MSVAEVKHEDDATVAEVININDNGDKKTRNIFFTLNNYTEEEYNYIVDWINKLAEAGKYGIVCKEVGSKCGTPHLHGYLEFKNDMRYRTLKTMLPRANLQKRKGKPHQAVNYIKKDGVFYENGELSAQGARSDIEEATKMINEGKSMAEVAEENPMVFVKYERGLKAYNNLKYKHRTIRPKVFWHWGLTGRGKTESILIKHGDNHYLKNSTKWWEGYEQQEAIIIDDFNGDWEFRDLLRLLDKNRYLGENKGGTIPINSPYIYITCEFPPDNFWSGNELDQVLSRMEAVINFVGEDLRIKDKGKAKYMTINNVADVGVAEVEGNTIPPLPAKIDPLFELNWDLILKR